MKLLIVTGLSGAGKSKVVDALEDIGFFCMDNMPPKLIPSSIQLILKLKEQNKKVAIVTDIRAGDSFNDLFVALKELSDTNYSYKILFIEANDDVLIRRFRETRRRHPLADKHKGSIFDAIDKEREILQPARQAADYVIDTSSMSAAQCRERIASLFLENPSESMQIHCISFGFKYGLPTEADLVFDVRCLPNPFYEDDLRDKTGLEEPVREYVLKWEQAQGLIPRLLDMIDYLIPLYRKEGKSQLMIAIGCTGGRHRSVVFSELIYKHLTSKAFTVNVTHRDIMK